MNFNNFNLSPKELEQAKNFIDKTYDFGKLMLQYECALMEIETKFRELDAEFSLQHDRNPIESIQSRLKDPMSLVEKLHRKALPVSLDVIEREIFDIAGVRIICSFEEDVYFLADCLAK